MKATIYESFSKELDEIKQECEKNVESSKKTAGHDWSNTKDEKKSSSLDINELSKKFDRQDCQDAYVEYWKSVEGSSPIDAMIIKFQNSVIAAHELAYRIRHASTPRSFAAGLCDEMTWSTDCIPTVLKKRLDFIINLYKEDAKSDT